MPTQITMTLNPADAGTKLTLEFMAKVNGLLAPMVKGHIRKQLHDDLIRLTNFLERGQPAD